MSAFRAGRMPGGDSGTRVPHGLRRQASWTSSVIMAVLALLACALVALPVQAQRAIDARMGRWATPGPDPTLYSVAVRRTLAGPLDVSLRGFGLVDDAPSGRSLYGLGPEVTLRVGGGALSPYAVAGTGLALERGEDTDVAAVWSAGAGLELDPFSWLGLAVEARRSVEDRSVRGFWALEEVDRRGWQVSARLSVRWGGGSGVEGRPRPDGGARPDGIRPGGPSPPTVPEGTSALGTSIVETALAAMGEPYRWGGESEESGFDCSGLVWYAYATHGVEIPRVSHRQARIGDYVRPEPARLRPGDILLFGEDSGEVTHVGLYVGEDRFIHSTTSGGVTVGALGAGADAEDRWWLRRWLGARRVLGVL